MKNFTFKCIFLLFITCCFVYSFGQYSVNFEGTGETKGGYASGNVFLSGISWNLTEVAIGTTATMPTEVISGTRSARFRGYGASVMSMNVDLSTGISNISFSYRNYPGDTQVSWVVEYSTDAGVNWSQAGSAFTAPTDNTVQNFFASVNVPGNARVRIKREGAPTNTNNRRLNIDDISVTPYTGISSNTSDYFRSRANGNFNDANSWESSTDGINWHLSTLVPTNLANTITTATGNTITVNSAVNFDQIRIFGTLRTEDGAVLNIANNIGDDLTVEAGGILNIANNSGNYSTLFLPATGSNMHILGNGKISVSGGVSGVPGDLQMLTSAASGNIWDTSSMYEWDCAVGNPASSDVTYFESADANTYPIFRISKVFSPIGGGMQTTINGIFDLQTNVTFVGGSHKNFRNGITGTGTLTQNTPSGNFRIAGNNAVLGGENLLIILNAPLHLDNIVTVPVNKDVTISGANINNNVLGNIFTINGRLDFTNVDIGNANGSVLVGSTGFFRTAGTTISGTRELCAIPSGIVTLNPGSTVELYALGNQHLRAKTDFSNLIFSGSGTKTISASFAPQGLVTIKENAIVDVENKDLGDNGTSLTMLDNAYLINRGAGTKPNVRGTYSLQPTTTIEFSGTAGTTIRLAPLYANIVISGTNISAGSAAGNGVTMQSGTTFRVKNGATFNATNSNGFSGALNTSVQSLNSPSIILEDGSTIGYTFTGNQTITAQTNIGQGTTGNYYNLKIAGTSGIKIPNSKTLIVNNETTVESATLNIPETSDTDVPYVLTSKKGIVNTGGTILFENNAQLMQDEAGVVNSGNITMTRKARLPKMGYSYWSSPVLNQNLFAFSDGDGVNGTPKDSFHLYDEETDYFLNTGAFLLDDNSVFEPALGYAIRGMNSFSSDPAGIIVPAVSHPFQFLGAPRNGALTFNLKRKDANHGYNLIGNPYPSDISFDALVDLNTNASKMFATVYFWTNNSLSAYNQQQQGSNYNGNNYAVYNRTGGAPSTYVIDPSVPALSMSAPNGIIKIGQGFIVRARAVSTIDFNNNIRVNNAALFYNNKAALIKDRFWLTLKTPRNVVNTILVGYVPGATNEWEIDYDGELFSLGSDAFYSVANQKNYTIQGRQYPLAENDVVQLGTHYFENGTYEIALKDPEGIFANGQAIYLKDKLTNTLTSLQQGSYTFTAEGGSTIDRFEIVYKQDTVLEAHENNKPKIEIYRDPTDFVVRTSNQTIENIELYDPSGRLVFMMSGNSKELRFSAEKLINGIYILKASLKNGEQFTKKIRK